MSTSREIALLQTQLDAALRDLSYARSLLLEIGPILQSLCAMKNPPMSLRTRERCLELLTAIYGPTPT